jgi:hypothetical protein
VRVSAVAWPKTRATRSHRPENLAHDPERKTIMTARAHVRVAVAARRARSPGHPPDDDNLTSRVVTLCASGSMPSREDRGALRRDVRHRLASLRGLPPATVVAEETEFGLRDLDPSDTQVVGLEYWRASERLPAICSGCSPDHRWASLANGAATGPPCVRTGSVGLRTFPSSETVLRSGRPGAG